MTLAIAHRDKDDRGILDAVRERRPPFSPDDVVQEFKAAGSNAEPRFWIAGGKGFHEGKAPQDVGYAFAGMWQGVIDVARSVANIKLPVDVNVGSWESPSESGIGQ